MVGVIFSDLSNATGPEDYWVQPSMALKCSLCSLLITALRMSGKVPSGGFYSKFIYSLGSLLLWFL